MQFQCDAAARVPIYRQLIDQVRGAVARGRVQPGDRLPSVRQLSRELVVNPNTIAKAYTELEREGVLNTRRGLGVFIAKPQAELSTKVRKERLLAALDLFLTEAVHLGFTAEGVTAALAKRIEQFRFSETRAATRGPREGSNDPSSDPCSVPPNPKR
ncbi:MAG: GntR family transcriptional regulator [Pirellulales bacterium]